MKNSIYLIMILFFLYGCSTDDSSEGNDDEGSGGNSNPAMLVKKINTNYSSGTFSEEIFHYVDNKLKAIEYDCYDIVRYFEYGASNKVLDSYRFSDANFDISTFNLGDVINDSGTNHTEYIYENNRLVRTKLNGILKTEFTYNNGLIKNIVINGYHTDNYIINYENNSIVSIFHSDETGDSHVYTFIWDDKKNPLYEIFLQFGIMIEYLDSCNSYDNYMLFKNLPLFKNNIITELVDNIPSEPATYVYLDNGLPEVISFDTYHGPVSHFFTY